jgi:small nuclear ribonucleoprotein (snRNP)-like protein
MALSRLVGRKVSVMIIGKDGNRETYKGVLKGIEDGYLILDTSSSEGYLLDEVLVKQEEVLSVWVYREERTY